MDSYQAQRQGVCFCIFVRRHLKMDGIYMKDFVRGRIHNVGDEHEARK